MSWFEDWLEEGISGQIVEPLADKIMAMIPVIPPRAEEGVMTKSVEIFLAGWAGFGVRSEGKAEAKAHQGGELTVGNPECWGGHRLKPSSSVGLGDTQ